MPESEPPVLSGPFQKFTAKAKQTVGRLIGDRDLAAEGQLTEARAEAAVDAARLSTEAEQREREAELAAALAKNQVEQQRAEAELSFLETEDQIERDQAAQQAKVDREFNRRQAILDDRARQRDGAIADEEAVIADARVDGAVEAAEVRQKAEQARAAAAELEAAEQEVTNQQKGH
jgi:uncharacterized protein YjbJ (UPF0337 family)